MNIIDGEIVVLDIAGGSARVACGKHDAGARLNSLGYVAVGEQMVRPISDIADRKKLVVALIELGALFSSGRGWSPAEIVDFYRDQGEVLTGYRMISWANPDKYVISDQ